MTIPITTYISIKNIPKISIILNVKGFAMLEHSSVIGVEELEFYFFVNNSNEDVR